MSPIVTLLPFILKLVFSVLPSDKTIVIVLPEILYVPSYVFKTFPYSVMVIFM